MEWRMARELKTKYVQYYLTEMYVKHEKAFLITFKNYHEIKRI